VLIIGLAKAKFRRQLAILDILLRPRNVRKSELEARNGVFYYNRINIELCV